MIEKTKIRSAEDIVNLYHHVFHVMGTQMTEHLDENVICVQRSAHRAVLRYMLPYNQYGAARVFYIPSYVLSWDKVFKKAKDMPDRAGFESFLNVLKERALHC